MCVQDEALTREAQDWRQYRLSFYKRRLNGLNLHVGTNNVTADRFLWACALVDNRAFSFDTADGMAPATVMAPVLDMLNHTHQANPDQRFESKVRSPCLS